MGMASYFFSLNVETILQPTNILDFFRQHYKVRSYDTIRRKKQLLTENERFSLDNRVVIEMSKAQNGIVLTFEVCFSNYQNNMMYVFEIAGALTRFGSVELVLPDQTTFPLPIDFGEFYRTLNHSHEAKYKLFTEKYGNGMRKNYLPNAFYKRRIRRFFS